jgi:hypothetical protein
MDPSLSYARESVLQSERLSSELHIKYIDSSMDSIRQWVYRFLSLGAAKDPETFPDPHHILIQLFTLMRIRILPFTVMRIRILPVTVMRIRIWMPRNDADPDPQDCLWHPIYHSCMFPSVFL